MEQEKTLNVKAQEKEFSSLSLHPGSCCVIWGKTALASLGFIHMEKQQVFLELWEGKMRPCV